MACNINFCGATTDNELKCRLYNTEDEIIKCQHKTNVEKVRILLLEIYKRDIQLNSQLPSNMMDDVLNIVGKGNEEDEVHKD